MAYTDQIRGSRRLSIIAGVAAVHGAIGYLFVSGLATNFVRDYVPVLTTTNVPIETPPPPDPTPPPPMSKTATVQPTTAPIRVVDAPAANFPVTVDLVPIGPLPMPSASATIEAQPEPPPPPSLATGVRVAGNRTAWFTNDDYPAAAIRAEEEGVVGVTLAIGTNGRVTDCQVTKSSGSGALDQATCRLYRSRGKFTAARDATGAPVTATYSDRVRWQLPMQ